MLPFASGERRELRARAAELLPLQDAGVELKGRRQRDETLKRLPAEKKTTL